MPVDDHRAGKLDEMVLVPGEPGQQHDAGLVVERGAAKRWRASGTVGSSTRQKGSVRPISYNFRAAAGRRAFFRSGTYRAKCTYRFTPEQGQDNEATFALSNVFDVA